jgi:FkbM family methyltransferase
MSPKTPPALDPDWQGQVGRLVNGMPIEVDPRDLVGSHILRSGVWEPETAWFFGQWLRPGMTVVDAGAHAGQYTLLASGLVGAGGRVIAFEPHPVLGQVLRRNVERAGCANVTVSPLALGRACGTADLFQHPPDNYGASSLRPDPAARHPRTPVQVSTLDDYLAGAGVPPVDVVKIDVEGAELDVVEGARRTLAAHPGVLLVVEFLRENAVRFGRTVEDLEHRLRGLGFGLFTLTRHGLGSYEPVTDLAANVVAVRGLATLLSGLPEPVAAATLLRLRNNSTGLAAG